MRTRFYIPIAFFAILLMVSCSDKLDSEGVSRITYFPVITLNNPDDQFVKVGDTYTEPGGTAKEGSNDLDLSISYTGTYINPSPSSTLNTGIGDIYTASYGAVNKDGFKGAQTRTIYVAGKGDLVNSIDGLYTSTVLRGGAGGAQYTNMKYVVISKIGANTYQISDAIGGYYDLGRKYGPGYAATGVVITANNIASNNFSFSGPVGVGAFGGAVEITSMDVNPATKTVHFQSTWDAGYAFDVTLKQVNF